MLTKFNKEKLDRISMLGSGRKLNSKVVMSIVGTSIAAVLVVAALTLSGQSGVVATSPNLIQSEPLSESSKILKIRNISIAEARSANSNIELQAIADDRAISFVAANRGQEPAALRADRWEATMKSESAFIPDVVQAEIPESVPGKGSTALARIDLSKHNDYFELFPGTYTVELIGWNWYEKDFGEFTKLGYWEDYVVRADVTIDYDVDLIKSSPNKLLKSKGMDVAIEGSGNAFEIDQNAPKIVSFYISNDKNVKTSGMVSGSQFNVWHSDNRFPSTTTVEVAYLDRDKCIVLNPGESKLLTAYEFSKESWPIAGPGGIAEEMGSETALPGLYIAHYQATTSPCTTDEGEEIPGDTHTVIVAMEVRP